MDFKLELLLVPVSDVDRAKALYTEKTGFNLEVDTRVSHELRVVQMTPPGSACSIAVGTDVGLRLGSGAPRLPVIRRLQRPRRQ